MREGEEREYEDENIFFEVIADYILPEDKRDRRYMIQAIIGIITILLDVWVISALCALLINTWALIPMIITGGIIGLAALVFTIGALVEI
jgi:hypothetical protein